MGLGSDASHYYPDVLHAMSNSGLSGLGPASPFFLITKKKLSIGVACGLSWPSDRIIIQVLDDSTDPTIKVLASIPSLCLTHTYDPIQHHGLGWVELSFKFNVKSNPIRPIHA